MLVLCDLSLNELHILLVKVGEKGKSAPEPTLAEPAVANHAHHGLAANAIANGTAHAASFMCLSH